MSHIHQFAADGEEIQALIFDKLMPAMEDTNIGTAVLSMITYSMFMMKPDIKIEELQEAVLSTSQFMVLLLSGAGAEDGTTPDIVTLN